MRNTTLRTFTYTNPSCYPIEAALLREPNLWVPGKKPVAYRIVNEENPLVRGMTDCLILNNPWAEYQFNSVYHQFPRQVIGGNDWAGGDLTFNGSTDWIFLGVLPARTIANGYTFTFYGTVSSLAAYNQLISCDYSGTPLYRAWQFRVNQTTGTLQAIRFNSSDAVLENFASSAAVSVDVPFIASMVFELGTGTFLYLNGNLVGSDLTYKDTANHEISTSSSYSPYIGRATTNGSPSGQLSGTCKTVFMHNRGLSAGEILSLHNDPYQFLIPA